MKIVFTWDDGALEDAKLFELHNRYKIPGMFFVPNYNKEGRNVISPEMIKQASSDLISFGGHTVSHSYLPTIPPEELDSELVDNRDYLSKLIGKPVEHFCLPGGKYDEALLQVCYKYYKTVRTADTMNYKNSGTLCRPTFHFYPRGKKSLIGNALKNKSISSIFGILLNYRRTYWEILYKLVDGKRNTNADIVIWGHSWEIEELNLWGELEKFMKYISQKYSDSCVSYDMIFK